METPIVYETKYYRVEKQCVKDPNDVLDYSWAVVNIKHETVEARCDVLPAAMGVADNLSEALGTYIDKPDLKLV